MIHQIETYPINSKPCGRSWQEWVQLWWQWCYADNIDESPANDNDGRLCSKNQKHSQVWFLAGTFGTSVKRRCLLPLGRSILFPILNDIISYATDSHLKDEKEMSTYAKADLDETRTLYVKVDEFELGNLKDYRVQTKLFEITLPPERHGECPRRTQAVSDGYWVFLKPLPVGNHVIHFIGEKLEYDKSLLPRTDGDHLPSFRVEVSYYLRIEQQRS